jgi:hypothetical protein
MIVSSIKYGSTVSTNSFANREKEVESISVTQLSLLKAIASGETKLTDNSEYSFQYSSRIDINEVELTHCYNIPLVINTNIFC